MAGKPASIKNMRTLPPMNPEAPSSAVVNAVTSEEVNQAVEQDVSEANEDPWAVAEAAQVSDSTENFQPSQPTVPVHATSNEVAKVPDYVVELEEQRRKNRELTELVLELNEKLDRLAASQQAKPQAPSTLNIDEKDLELSPNEQEVYKESLPVIEKVVKRHLKQLENVLTNRIEEVKTVSAKNDLSSFVNAVQLRVPNARALTKDPSFIRYLSERIPGTGLTRKQIFDLAHENRDLEAVVSIFEGFSDKPDATASMKAPSSVAANPQVTAPTRSTQGRKPVFKESDSKRLSEDFRSGKISLDVYKKRRALLEEAVREGRIIRGK